MPEKMFPKDPVPVGTGSKKEPLDPWYVTGFCDGECAFTYSLQSTSLGLAVYFNLKLHERDRSLLEKIQKYFGGIGRIYVAKDPRPNAATKAYYRITDIHDLQTVIKHFDKYPPHGSKAKGYSIWRKMVSLKYDNYGHPPNDDLIDLADELSKLNNSNATSRLRKTEDRRKAKEKEMFPKDPVPAGTEQASEAGTNG